MNKFIKRAILVGVSIMATGMVAVANVQTENNVKPIAPVVGTVLYKYNMINGGDANEYPNHNGIDILYDDLTFIHTPISGKVEKAGHDSFGAYIVITDEKNHDSVEISSLQEVFMEEGDTVNTGDEIGVTGDEYIHVAYYPKGFKTNETTDPTAFLILNGTKLNFDKAEKI